MRFTSLLSSWLALSASLVAAVPAFPHAQATRDVESEYDYVIVGSGAGGGPLACRLAMAGYKTLLLEAGGDANGNVNVSVPGYQAVVTQDPTLRWDIFVNHYKDQNRAKRDPKYTYELHPYEYHVGPNPPYGAREKGILYPRSSVLGGCVTHNALIWITPHKRDWDIIANLTGDESWEAKKMNKYLNRVYQWLPAMPTDPTILLRDAPLARHLVAGARAAGLDVPVLTPLVRLGQLLLTSPNSRLNPVRDYTEGYFQVPLTMKFGTRMAVREYIQETVAAGHPLTVHTHTFVTKINFDTTSGKKPRATGVEFVEGQYLYKASPLHRTTSGKRGTVKAKRQLIIAGGTFNTPQLLKLSGIGPRAELQRFGIPVIKDLPGVGTNMMDRYEIPVNVKHTEDFKFPILDGCHFDLKEHDLCLKQWLENPYILGARGAYASNGLASMMLKRSDFASSKDVDLSIFGGPLNFQGYFPGWHDFSVRDHGYFSWYSLKAHSRNRAGTVELRSADPFDQPLINFNYFDEGTKTDGADQKDLGALIQAIRKSREALEDWNKFPILGGTPFVEEKPGAKVQSDEEIGQYIKDEAWGHHAACTCPIGPDSNPMAVLDSEFRVRGVDGLRVVDASIFPDIPGVFIQSAIFMASEKAADILIKEAKAADGVELAEEEEEEDLIIGE
ncbi:putative GMC oxidoreductase [Podospora australis]|uniref:GMC oxidoreductase n=1 Tax=Podospora australis TaxID=1536484 RepID=A0AAN6WK68_9PEZI|nr:putative GMC oxidoreductase [Podospora australis]